MGNEQRATLRLIGLWEKLASDSPPPPYTQWNSANISDIWHQCMTMSVEPSAGSSTRVKLTTVFVGDQLKSILPNVRTGDNYQLHILEPDMKKLLTPISDVLTTQNTVAREGTFVSKNNKIVKYRCCYLPFSDKKKNPDDSETVDYVVAGFSWMQV